MTYRDALLREDIRSLHSSASGGETAATVFQNIVDNHSPIMKLWFIVMLVNLVFVLCLI
jgi:hypothetical protein